LPVTGVFDASTEAVVTAFQRHFRPARVDGVADSSTITTLRNLIASRPG
jgi:N-acetylmuramoyl-L-alanine amidase